VVPVAYRGTCDPIVVLVVPMILPWSRWSYRGTCGPIVVLASYCDDGGITPFVLLAQSEWLALGAGLRCIVPTTYAG